MLTGENSCPKPHSGRPSSRDRKDIPAALRRAARQAIARDDGGQFTASEVATIAGVDPAMINYYFVNKSGLISSIIDDALLIIFDKLRAIERSVHKDREIDTRKLVDLLSRHYFSIAPLVRTLMKEVGNEKSETHKNYLVRDARNFRQIEAILRACVDHGIYRPDLDVRHAALSLTCLTAALTCLSPTFINSAPAGEKTGPDHLVFTFEELIANGWIERTSAMLDREFRTE